jgi:hypothetical protein
MVALPGTIEEAVVMFLVLGAITSFLRAAFLLMFRIPAKARLVEDGYRRFSKARNAAVFMHERVSKPLTVEDLIAFSTIEREAVRISVRRLAIPRDQTLLVWYSPRRPENAATIGPMGWLGWLLASIATLAVVLYS